MSADLSGKSVLVTGATAGIGRAAVAAFVAAGATVLATGRRQDALDDLVAQHGADRVQIFAGNLNDQAFVAELAAAAADVDILVSNAGILTYAPLLDMTFEQTEAMFRTNVLGSFAIMHALAKPMAARGHGHIILITSTAAREVYPLGVVYCATKYALTALAQGFRRELQASGVKVSEIAPGMVDTDIRATSNHPRVIEALDARRFTALTPEEVAEAVIYVASASENCAPDLLELRPRGAA